MNNNFKLLSMAQPMMPSLQKKNEDLRLNIKKEEQKQSPEIVLQEQIPAEDILDHMARKNIDFQITEKLALFSGERAAEVFEERVPAEDGSVYKPEYVPSTPDGRYLFPETLIIEDQLSSEEVKVVENNGNGKDVVKDKSYYDESGNLLKKIEWMSDGRTVVSYFYEFEGTQATISAIYDENNNVISSSHNYVKYDEEGRLVWKKSVNYDENHLKSSAKEEFYTYNDDGSREIKIKTYDFAKMEATTRTEEDNAQGKWIRLEVCSEKLNNYGWNVPLVPANDIGGVTVDEILEIEKELARRCVSDRNYQLCKSVTYNTDGTVKVSYINREVSPKVYIDILYDENGEVICAKKTTQVVVVDEDGYFLSNPSGSAYIYDKDGNIIAGYEYEGSLLNYIYKDENGVYIEGELQSGTPYYNYPEGFKNAAAILDRFSMTATPLMIFGYMPGRH